MSVKSQQARLAAIALGVVFIAGACGDNAEVGESPSAFDSVEAAHILPPTDEMMELARSQCDDGRSQGIVELVSPGTDEVVSRAVVDCS